MAGEYDALIPNCYARLMSEKIPGSRFVLVPGAGHNPMSEVPDVVLPMITRFLRTGDPGELAPARPKRQASAHAVTPESIDFPAPLVDRLAAFAPEGRPR
jgi:hypothetical protein